MRFCRHWEAAGSHDAFCFDLSDLALLGCFTILKSLVGYRNTCHAADHWDVPVVGKLSEYVLTKEAAELLGVLQNTMRTWAEDGRIPMHRNPANDYRLFRREDFEHFLLEAATPVVPARNR